MRFLLGLLMNPRLVILKVEKNGIKKMYYNELLVLDRVLKEAKQTHEVPCVAKLFEFLLIDLAEC